MNDRRQPNLAQFSRETILDADQCAEWLGISIDMLERADVPAVFLGNRTRRYVVGEVLDFFSAKLKRAS